MKGLMLVLALLTTFLAVGCGGGKSGSSTPPTQAGSIPTIQGPWEIAMNSASHPGYNALIEVNFKSQGVTFSSSQIVEVPVQSISTGGPPIGSLPYDGNYYDLNSPCLSASGNIRGSLSGKSVGFTYEVISGIVFNAQGTYDGTTIEGTYQNPATNAGCADSGTFTAYPVSLTSGTYTGTLLFPNGNLDTVTASFTTTCDVSSAGDMCPMAASGTVSGADNGPFSLTGRAIGNFLELGGSGQTVLRTPVSYYCVRLSGASKQPILVEDVWPVANYFAGVLSK